MTPEGKVKAKVREMLKLHGAWHCSPATHGYGKPGVPDIIGSHKGWFFGIEVKATAKGKPTKLQVLQLEQITKSGGMSMLIHEDNLFELKSWLTRNRYAK